MKSHSEYLRDADELIDCVVQDIPESTNARLRRIGEALWQVARAARREEHLHYCAICRHRKPCSRMTKIRKGIS